MKTNSTNQDRSFYEKNYIRFKQLKQTMKTYLSIFSFIIFSISIIAQGDCPVANSSGIANWNSILAKFNHSRADFTSDDGSSAGFEYPIFSGTNAIFSSGFLFSGTSEGGELKVSSQLYGEETDFAPGPLSVGDVMTFANNCDEYDQFWLVTAYQIELHLNYFDCLNDTDCDLSIEFPNGYGIPNNILTWPAHGDLNLNEAEYLAPFYDYDNDGTYIPENGDCPLHADLVDVACDEGLRGDVSLFWIENDRRVFENGSSTGIEVHNIVYAYLGSDLDPIYDKCLFHKRTIFNRGIETISNARVGVFVDPDLGNPGDDFVGCDVDKNTAYVYNADNNDEDTSVLGYGSTPPAIGFKLIQGPLQDPDEMDNDENGIIDDETLNMGSFMSISGDAISSNLTIYNAMNSIFPNGQPLTYSDTDIEALYMYPASSDSEFIGTNGVAVGNWVEGDNGGFPGDRKFIMSSESFTLSPGAERKFTFVYIARDFVDSPWETVGELLEYSGDLGEDFDECNPGVVNIDETLDVASSSLHLYPNPALNHVSVQGIKSGNKLEVINSLGQIVMSETTQKDVHSLDISGLVSGIYVVRVGDGLRSFSERLVVGF